MQSLRVGAPRPSAHCAGAAGRQFACDTAPPTRRRVRAAVQCAHGLCAPPCGVRRASFSSSKDAVAFGRQTSCTSRRHVAARTSSGGANSDADEVKQEWKHGRNEGPITWPWKLLCGLLYMLPWVDVTSKGVYFVERFPNFAWTEYFTEPFEHWFYIHEWAPLIIFFGTYLGFVRNKGIPHVARYHLMMGVMLDICAMILIVIERNLPFGVIWTPWSDLFYGLSFLAIFLMVCYCLFFCWLGWYCEIPLISEGVYIQIEQAEQMGQS